MSENKIEETVSFKKIQVLVVILVTAGILVQAYNFSVAGSISSSINQNNFSTGNTSLAANLSDDSGQPANNSKQISLSDIIPSGIPEIYGAELGVSYDEPVKGIDVLGKLDTSINLEGELQQRYIKVTTSISCEFCCGAKSITFPDGKAACGCAHSYAMRGLAKYLLQNHSSDYTDQEILNELTKWKTLFFPKQMTKRALELAAKEGTYNEELLNKVNEGVPDMVGGC
jgi:hypothetical protein